MWLVFAFQARTTEASLQRLRRGARQRGTGGADTNDSNISDNLSEKICAQLFLDVQVHCQTLYFDVYSNCPGDGSLSIVESGTSHAHHKRFPCKGQTWPIMTVRLHD